MKDKQEEDISWLFLWGATILYIAVLCMAFAGMVVTRPTVGAAFLEFTKDYGSLLAGIPVLIAVLVAKQQLEANRLQHVATVKRELRVELDALDAVKVFALQYTDYHVQMAARYHGMPFVGRMYAASGFTKPDQKLWLNVSNCNSPRISQAAFDLLSVLNDGEPYKFIPSGAHTLSEQAGRVWDRGRLVYCANTLIEEIKDRHKHLSQYWS